MTNEICMFIDSLRGLACIWPDQACMIGIRLLFVKSIGRQHRLTVKIKNSPALPGFTPG